MKKWEKIILALNSPEQWQRARYMFELFEEERKDGVSTYRSFSSGTETKLAVNAILKRVKEKLENSGDFKSKATIDACVEEIEKEEKDRKLKEIEALEKA